MKALDTPALLAILEGRPEAPAVLREVAGGEVCTTELNLFELEAIARCDSKAGRSRRLAMLDRLRRKISVLPLDERGSRAAAQLAAARRGAATEVGWLILGILVANGATELLTTEAAHFAGATSPIAVRLIRKTRS